jgi:dicarboxylate transporter 10
MALAGCIAGGVAGVLANPAELMMVRMQADKAKPIESESYTRSFPVHGGGADCAERYNYRNSLQGLYRMTREEGFSSWARGVVPNGFRAILMNMSQLAR